MLVKIIEILNIDDTDRLRPVTREAVTALAHDIAARGLRQPIEVVAQIRGKKYRLVSGGHRLAACKSLELKEIPAVIISGTDEELRRHELLENLARNELSVMERAQFLAELKRLYQEAHPDAKHGGDRTKEQTVTLTDWYEVVSARSQSSRSTIERYSAIGERLAPNAADALRGTPFEDSLKELKALSQLGLGLQVDVTKRLLRIDKNRAKTVGQAVDEIEGRKNPEVSATDRQFSKLIEAWSRSNADAKAQFLSHLTGTGEFDRLRGV